MKKNKYIQILAALLICEACVADAGAIKKTEHEKPDRYQPKSESYEHHVLHKKCAQTSLEARYEKSYDNGIAPAKWLVADPLKKIGIDTRVSLHGFVDAVYTGISQDVETGMESSVGSVRSDTTAKVVSVFPNYAIGAEFLIKVNSGVYKRGAAAFDTADLFVDTGKYGIFWAGFLNGAAHKCAINGENIMTGFRGPDSLFLNRFYNVPAGAIVATMFSADDYRAAKLHWESSSFHGFHVNASWTPDTRRTNPFRTTIENETDVGAAKAVKPFAQAHSKNLWSFALTHEHGSEKGFNAKTCVSCLFGNGECNDKTEKVHNTKALNIGTILGYKDVKWSVGYTDNYQSLLPVKMAADQGAEGFLPGYDAGKIYATSILYHVTPALNCSVGYFKSVANASSNSQDQAVVKVITAGAEYKINKHLSVYGEYDRIKGTTSDRMKEIYSKIGNNSANAVIMAVRFSF